MAQNFISRFRRVVLTLTLAPFFLLASDVYILSYTSQVKNNQLIHQSLYASLAMTPVKKKVLQTYTISLDKECKQSDFFNCYESEVLDILLKSDVRIYAQALTQKLIAQSFSQLQIAPQYVEVEFNDTFVKISLLH